MTIREAMEARHAVRSYTDKKIPEDIVSKLAAVIRECNAAGALDIQLVTEEPKAFDGFLAHYGKFTGVRNYVALIGPKGPKLDEKAGYYGEKIALAAQQLGLNTCWVALTFSKGAVKKSCKVGGNEKLSCVMALGYGTTPGVPHHSKPLSALCHCEGAMPDWFRSGMEAACLAPTAVNQQKFLIALKDGQVSYQDLGGPYSQVDLGIVKYHFEIGSGRIAE